MKSTHPKALWVICFGKLWDTFSYFGTQTVLAIYLIKIFKVSQSDSYLIYGAYAALAFSMPLFGGVIADKFIGSKKALIVGSILNIAGNIALVVLNKYIFCLGLALSLVGSGLYKSNSTNLVGTIYPQNDSRKETAFTWFYISINIGGTLSPIIYGVIMYYAGWNYAFLASSLGILTGLILFLKNGSLFKSEGGKGFAKRNIAVLFIITILCFLISLMFYFPGSINFAICILFLTCLLYLLRKILNHQGVERKNLLGLLALSFFGMFYFAMGLQIGTTITLFIQNEIGKGAIQTNLPPSSFSMMYAFFVIILAPVFTWIWSALKKRDVVISAPTKLFMGISLASLGILSFIFSSLLTSYIILFLVIGYAFLSAGELVLTPSVYAAISNLSPNGMRSTMMGGWLLFVAIGGYLSSTLANSSSYIVKRFSIENLYFGQFLFIFTLSILVLLTFFICLPKIKSMLKNKPLLKEK